MTFDVPVWASLPFAILLLSIACLPFISRRIWERYYGHIAIGLGLLTAAGYAIAFGGAGVERMAHAGLDYFNFIALVGSLFVISGSLGIDVSSEGSPVFNTLLLAGGALLSNVLGTTGASVLLIRPFMQANRSRLRGYQIFFFIAIVSNCGGVLTPLGPPLFLGYLAGVPFTWTILHCWKAWLLVNGLLLALFFIIDKRTPSSPGSPAFPPIKVHGLTAALFLIPAVMGIFIDPLAAIYAPVLQPIPLGALWMALCAAATYRLTPGEERRRNHFSFHPLNEVALLFLGIFLTMVPALDYIERHAAELGMQNPSTLYFGSGILSSFLDNAPTYLNFLSGAHGAAKIPFTHSAMPQFLAGHSRELLAISLGSALFGACTYIGNGPNFMVKTIAESYGAPTPGFFEYIAKYTLPILLPVLILVWLIFFWPAN